MNCNVHARRLALLAAVLLACIPPSLGRIIRVNPASTATVQDGDSWETAYKTLSGAVTASVDGDELWLAAGSYPSQTVTKGLALFGGFAGTEAERSQRRFRMNASVVNGTVTISAGSKPYRLDGFVLAGVTISSTAGVVANNIVRSGLTVAGSPTIRNNLFRLSSRGIHLTNSQSVVVNNTFAWCGTAVSLNGASSPVLVNNAVTFNVNAITTAWGWRGAPVFRNNGFHGNRSTSSLVAIPIGTDGNTDADPRCASAAMGDSHLQPDSPYRDAGSDADVADGDRDADDQDRIQGAHVDIGADESDGTLWDIPMKRVYVSPTGKDTNDGLSWATARKTLASAVTLFDSGGETWVAAGTYADANVMPFVSLYGGFAGSETQLSERDPRANVTCITGQLRVYTAASTAVVDGFTFRVNDLSLNGASPVISNNRFVGAPFGISATGGSSPLVTGNRFIGNRIGVSAYLASPIVANCVITGCGQGISVSSSTVQVVNCTLVGNDVAIYAPYASTPITNCVIAWNNLGVEAAYGTPDKPVVTYSCFFGNAKNTDNFGVTPGENGNIAADPLLAGTGGVEPHLQPDSPCRNAGNGATVWGLADVDGQPRVQDGNVDIGADEADGSTRTVTPAIVRVAPGGSDAADGATWGTAKNTLASAFDALLDRGGEVWVRGAMDTDSATVPPYVSLYGGFSGTETERSQRNPAMNVTELSGGIRVAAGSTVVVVDGLTIPSAPRFAVDCLSGAPRIENCVIGPWCAIGIQALECSPVVSRCDVSAYGTTLQNNKDGVYLLRSNATVQDSVFHDCENGVALEDYSKPLVTRNTFRECASGVLVGTFGQATVLSNRLEGNTDGVKFLPRVESTAFEHVVANNLMTANGTAVNVKWSRVRLVNNTLAGNTGAAVVSDTADVRVANSIIAFNGKGIQMFAGFAPTVNATCFFSNASGNIVGFTSPIGSDGNVVANPVFVSRTTGDHHLQAGSPCIDAGDNAAVDVGWLDLDGLPRIRGLDVDMGAYEVQTALTPMDRLIRSLRACAGVEAVMPTDLGLLDADADGRVALGDCAEWARRAGG